jgi:hypothetical protein
MSGGDIETHGQSWHPIWILMSIFNQVLAVLGRDGVAVNIYALHFILIGQKRMSDVWLGGWLSGYIHQSTPLAPPFLPHTGKLETN